MHPECSDRSSAPFERPGSLEEGASPGLYLHIPFCQRKCAYCDFPSCVAGEALYASYLAALRLEMRARARAVKAQACTLYLGGGTPTVLPALDLAALIEEAWRAFALSAGAEVTVEANPGTVDEPYLRALHRAGVNRLSLGVQSFEDRLLRLLGRIHTAQEAEAAVRDARAAGFENLNLDLMLGLPQQALSDWQESLLRARDLAPEHLSLYALTVEEGTPLARWVASGAIPAPDDDLAAEMYEWAEEALAEAGYVHYEISNWARPGLACQHNLIYWRNEPYLGLGAAAHSWWNRERRANARHPAEYIQAVSERGEPAAEVEPIDRQLEMSETMMMGLRLLCEGVSFARFERRFGVGLDDVYGAQIAGLVARGLLERTAERIRLTRRGHLLGNQVFVEFLG
jgi:oxygen-independent coproporphyrinogen-3 oxidase